MTAEQPLKAMPAVVGIGAAAGGLAALKGLLEHVPADSGLAFVIVAQVPGDEGVRLADVLQPHARFPVELAIQASAIEPNRAYIIPPDADLMAISTHLHWIPLEERRRGRAPVDHLLRMLAGTYDGHTISVILSGAGSDGTLGIQDVKANGGVIIVQDPAEAEYAGMPKSAAYSASAPGRPAPIPRMKRPPESCCTVAALCAISKG